MFKVEFIKYMKKKLVKAFLHIFWLFPVDMKKVFLLNELSYTYGDSLKYIDKYIKSHNINDYSVVFAIKKGCEEPVGDVIVRPGSIKYFKEILTSGFVITNAGGISYLPKRKPQLFINTWHGGGPYKKTSTDVYNNYWYRKEVIMNHINTDYILSSCKNFTEVEAKSMGFDKDQCIPSGLPRNDILFGNHSDIVKKVREYYSITDDKKFVLYAPTFRSSSNQSDSKMISNIIDLDIDLLLSSLKIRFNSEWVCGVRLHPKLANIDMSDMTVLNCTTYPDMQELLCCTDAIITDYSSLMWDYSFTYRPIFLYAPDIEQYEKEHGFYMPVSEWPYPIAHNNDEMSKIILCFDETEYIKCVKNHHRDCESYENGNSCKKLLELIKLER